MDVANLENLLLLKITRITVNAYTHTTQTHTHIQLKRITFAKRSRIQGLSAVKSNSVSARVTTPAAQKPGTFLVGVILSTNAGRLSINVSHCPTLGPFK